MKAGIEMICLHRSTQTSIDNTTRKWINRNLHLICPSVNPLEGVKKHFNSDFLKSIEHKLTYVLIVDYRSDYFRTIPKRTRWKRNESLEISSANGQFVRKNNKLILVLPLVFFLVSRNNKQIKIMILHKISKGHDYISYLDRSSFT